MGKLICKRLNGIFGVNVLHLFSFQRSSLCRSLRILPERRGTVPGFGCALELQPVDVGTLVSALPNEGESVESLAEAFSVDTDRLAGVSEDTTAVDVLWVCNCSTGISGIGSSIILEHGARIQ